MYRFNNIIQVREYGEIVLKVSEVMDRCNVTRNRLSKITGIKYSIVDRYYRAENVERVDLDVLAKICFALGCGVDEVLEYAPPSEY